MFKNISLSTILIAVFIALPILTIFQTIFMSSGGAWQHQFDNLLPVYLSNTLFLSVFVSIGTFILGTSTAWIITMYKFPGKKLFQWLLLMPMAFPAYLLGYVYTELFDISGPLQIFIRQSFDLAFGEYWFPDIRTLTGASFIFTLAFYPYVYLLSRASFIEQSACLLDASKTLSVGPFARFFKVALPLVRPSIFIGIALSLMETLNDFGTVQHFGVNTLTTGIYRSWVGMGEKVIASQLALILLLIVSLVLIFERITRKKAQYYNTTTKTQCLTETPVQGFSSICMILICLLPVFLGFLLPLGILFSLSIEHYNQFYDHQYIKLIKNSFIVATIAAILTTILGLIIAFQSKEKKSKIQYLLSQIASSGYALPGSIIAVGLLSSLGGFDRWLQSIVDLVFDDVTVGLIFSGTFFALIYAYVVRFLTLSHKSIESGLTRIKPSLNDAAKSFGYSGIRRLFMLYIPLMRGSILTALLIVFVEVLKELPATMIIRPFNFDTLSIEVYRLASDERLAEASNAALTIVLIGIIPVLLLSRQISKSRPNQ